MSLKLNKTNEELVSQTFNKTNEELVSQTFNKTNGELVSQTFNKTNGELVSQTFNKTNGELVSQMFNKTNFLKLIRCISSNMILRSIISHLTSIRTPLQWTIINRIADFRTSHLVESNKLAEMENEPLK